MVIIEWETDFQKGGQIYVSPTGVSVDTDCCGCGSVETNDVDSILRLQKALTDLLRGWGVSDSMMGARP